MNQTKSMNGASWRLEELGWLSAPMCSVKKDFNVTLVPSYKGEGGKEDGVFAPVHISIFIPS